MFRKALAVSPVDESLPWPSSPSRVETLEAGAEPSNNSPIFRRRATLVRWTAAISSGQREEPSN